MEAKISNQQTIARKLAKLSPSSPEFLTEAVYSRELLANKNFFLGQEKFATDEQKAWEKEQFGKELALNVR